MMEGPPSQENPQENLKKLKNEAIEALRNFGLEDPRAKESFVKWLEVKEAEVEASGSREKQVQFEVERAEIYLQAGFNEEAKTSLEDALTIAVNKGLTPAQEDIEKRIKNLP